MLVRTAEYMLRAPFREVPTCRTFVDTHHGDLVGLHYVRLPRI